MEERWGAPRVCSRRGPEGSPEHRAPYPPPPARPCVQSKFRVNQHCKVLCRIGSLNKAQANAFKSRISDEYRVNM